MWSLRNPSSCNGGLWSFATRVLLRSSTRSAFDPSKRKMHFWTNRHTYFGSNSSKKGNSNSRDSKNRRRGRRSFATEILIPATGLSKTVAVLGLAATGSVSYYYNELEQMFGHASMVSERSSRVVVAAALCFNDYRNILNKKFDTDEERAGELSKCHQRCADRTYKVIEDNAGIYIKMGQHISAMTYLLPPEWTNTFIPLQDQCPTSSMESIKQMFKYDTGRELDEVFIDLDPKPLGVASLAQVHKARLRDTGEEVAVKFQHPALAEFIPLDVKLTKIVFSAIDRFFPEYSLLWLYNELNESIFVELDFTKEAENAIFTQEYFRTRKQLTALRIPDIIWAKPRILVMEYITGARPDNLVFINEHHISRNEVSICLSHIFNTMIFTPGVRLHCDPHGGNLAIRPLPKSEQGPWYNRGRNFEIVLYDHGLYREIPTLLRRSYARFWLAVIDSDESSMRKYANEFAGISDSQFPLFASAITGRDFEHAKGSIMTRRSKQEMQKMVNAVQGGLMPSLMKLLAQVPNIVLLILKTNDLTRALDECLDTSLGPERTFLIMAMYCARTVLDDDTEKLKAYPVYSWAWISGETTAYWTYYKRTTKVKMFDITVWLMNLLHM
ncbi:ABC1 family-domain-containing protein [Lipomyces oligophaga]|uniref:ABC1 family-domain-containing protein n=1 Tax=Lipomyces oligophaga TaxID=45792 RepID=UPI0034CE8273